MEHQGHGTGEKKGIVENIQEKLSGGHADHQQTGGTFGQQGHTGVTDTGTHGTGEKKGVMEKLTGGHGEHQQTTGMTGKATHGTQATGTHGTDATGEKKGIMDNIKDKLPGQH